MSFAETYGPWALVTGAGQGMGAAFASDVAGRGIAVALVDREEGLLAARAQELQGLGAQTREIVVDLVRPGAADRILEAVADVDVGLLVSNAAMVYVGEFLDQGARAGLDQITVNCSVPLALVHALLPRMVSRGRGGVVLLASGSALRGSPLVAGYAATKAWNLVLAESLWDEVRDAGVDVMAVLPGTTRTPGLLSTNPQSSMATTNLMEPEEVVRETLDALGTAPSLIAGQANRDSEAFMSALDRAEAVRVMGTAMRAMYPPDREPDPTL